jgi:hypothetical protein
LNDWEIDAASIRRDGDRPVDALDLIAGFHQQPGIGAEMLPCTSRRSARNYVKTALSVLNMGFMRGLSPTYMAATPAINDWVYGLVENDAY